MRGLPLLDDNYRLRGNTRRVSPILGVVWMTTNEEAAKQIALLAIEQEWDTDDLLSFYETFIFAHFLTVGFLRFLEGIVSTESEVNTFDVDSAESARANGMTYP